MFGILRAVGRSLGLPTSKAEYIISNVEIAQLRPGRIQVIYPELSANAGLRDEVESALHATPAVTSFAIDPDSGSVTINYAAERIGAGSFLQELLVLAERKYRSSRT